MHTCTLIYRQAYANIYSVPEHQHASIKDYPKDLLERDEAAAYAAAPLMDAALNRDRLADLHLEDNTRAIVDVINNRVAMSHGSLLAAINARATKDDVRYTRDALEDDRREARNYREAADKAIDQVFDAHAAGQPLPDIDGDELYAQVSRANQLEAAKARVRQLESDLKSETSRLKRLGIFAKLTLARHDLKIFDDLN